jgi:hypothetical protein
MSIDERIALIEQARGLVACAMSGSGLPQIEAILRSADMELHWALWNMGHPVPLLPQHAADGSPSDGG